MNSTKRTRRGLRTRRREQIRLESLENRTLLTGQPWSPYTNIALTVNPLASPFRPLDGALQGTDLDQPSSSGSKGGEIGSNFNGQGNGGGTATIPC